jgi:hypothetical protein
MSEIGRISGQLLFDNLTREGTDLAFETSLLYLNVNAKYIGVNSDTPYRTLTVNGTSSTVDLYADTRFSSSELDITVNQIVNANGDINLSASGLMPQITANIIQTDNLQFGTNTISTYANDDSINIVVNGTGQLKIQSNVLVDADLHATGDITFDGNITLGNANTDTVTFGADINSDILPSQTSYSDNRIITDDFFTITDDNGLSITQDGSVYSLGSSQLQWKTVYVNTQHSSDLYVTDFSTVSTTIENLLQIDGNTTIGSSSSNTVRINGQLINSLVPTGSFNLGSLSNRWNNLYADTAYISGINITSNSVNSTTADANLTFTANGLGVVTAANLSFNQGTIANTLTGGADQTRSVILKPNGTGQVQFSGTGAVIFPKGNNGTRALAIPGEVRYNTVLNSYEGFNNSVVNSLYSVYDVARTTYILPETTPGNADNSLGFYVNNSLKLSIDTNGLSTTRVDIGDIQITDLNIATVANNSDLTLEPYTGGKVNVNNFSISGSDWTNTTVDAVSVIENNGIYYSQFDGTALSIPVWTASDPSPVLVEAGMQRYNSVNQILEVYTGTEWVPAGGGVNSTVSEDIVAELTEIYALIF